MTISLFSIGSFQDISIFDFLNFFIIFSFLFFSVLYFQLNLTISLILFLHLITSLLFHPLFIGENIYPDVQNYFEPAIQLRSGFEEYFPLSDDSNIYKSPKSFQTFLFSFFPMFIETYYSLALINLCFFYFLFFYCYQYKIFTFTTTLLYLLLPSIFLYSSIAIKEMLVFFFVFISMHQLLFKHNYFLSLLFVSPLFILRMPNLFIYFVIFFIFIILTLYLKKYYTLTLLFIISSLSSYLFLSNNVSLVDYNLFNFLEIQKVKISLAIENELTYDLSFNITSFISDLAIGIVHFIIYPFFNNVSLNEYFSPKIYFIVENIFLKLIVAYLFIFNLKKYNKQDLCLDFFFFLSAMLYGYVNVNYFNMNRYAFCIVITYILLKSFLLKKKYRSDLK